MTWFLLLLGGFCEVGFTTCLHKSENLTHWNKNWIWGIGFFVFLFFSMWFLNEASKRIPLGTCYAVWTGIGAAGTVLVGMIFYREPTNLLRIVFIFTLVVSIIGLKLSHQ
jgi:quaternary ammonium compound-resistance protein SugE